MEQQLTEEGLQNVSQELDGSRMWIDKAIDMAWVMKTGTYDESEAEKAYASGQIEEFVKKNYTFSVPFSKLHHKKMWVYRDVPDMSL
ncbi:hypothetical protein BGZ73_001243 [Actinomortierella ambigua]|nr:hypothetical protein BGZ73_001243 [Actinomortierella ambigua]